MTQITSLQNPRVKAALRLRDGRHRAKQGRIIIDGARELGRAIQSGVRLLEVFVYRAACGTPDAERVVGMLDACGAEILEVAGPVLEKLTFGQRCEGLLGVAETPGRRLDELVLPDCPLVAVLEGAEKPGNVGAVLRSADGAGVSALVVAGGGTDPFNPNAIRASLGTIFTMPLAAAGTAETIDWLRERGLAVYAARVDGSVPYTEADLRQPAAIVLGSEAGGLTEAWSGDWLTALRLPMLGAADSLNVSATAAVLFYEALRQRSGA